MQRNTHNKNAMVLYKDTLLTATYCFLEHMNERMNCKAS